MDVGQAVPIIVALLSGFLAYRVQVAVANKSKSGSSRTAEAETVFAELRLIKDEYKSQLAVALKRIDTLEHRVEDLEKERRQDDREHGQEG